MGNCIYCGQKAGMLKKKHDKCERNYKSGFNKMVEQVKDVITFRSGYNEINPFLNAICHDTFNQYRRQEAILTAWDLAVEYFLEDGVLSVDEEDKIEKFMKHFNLNMDDLDKNNSYSKVVQAKLEKLISSSLSKTEYLENYNTEEVVEKDPFRINFA